MEIRFSHIYIIVHLVAVFALFVSPFIFFNAYAENSQNVWTITIPNGVSENKDQKIFPNELPVLVGDKIVWENKDSVIHNIASGLPSNPEHSGLFFNLGQIQPGSSKSYVLTNADFNAYYYFCKIHPWMTGKIFISSLDISQPETDIPIFLEKLDYIYGDKISISGKVHKDFAGTQYTTLIYNKNNELANISNGIFDDDASYLQIIKTNEKAWDEGEYKVKLVYAVPSKVAEANFQLSPKFNTNQAVQNIPEWIKKVGDYWCNGQIDDTQFVNLLQYLIKNDIIELNNKSEKIISNDIPAWVKNNACLWSEDKIPDLDFIFGIKYLTKIGIVRI
ncbi:MAG: hypothetical protein ACE5RN_08105 [Nitrosopumilaceae archaeon]